MTVWIVLFTKESETEIINVCASEEIAKKVAIKFLKEYCGETLEDLDVESWSDALEWWRDLTEGYEYFTIESQTVIENENQ